MIKNLATLENNTDEMLDFIEKISVFKGLSQESLKKISEKIHAYTFDKDTPIVEKDSIGARLYMIKSGSARVVTGAGHEEFTVATIQEGVCFGEMSLLTGEPCCATVKTNEDSLLYSITKGDFDNIIAENPFIYKHFNKLFAERINKQNTKSTQLKEHEIALNRYLLNIKEHRYSSVIIGKCRNMRKTLQEVENLSNIDDPIIVAGGPGAGKELIARKIHTDSKRAKYPVIEFALPRERRSERKLVPHDDRRKKDQISCELFGNEKMKIANETEKRIGRLELVNNGTMMIKNIENMPVYTQEKFLKFLESKSFSRVGGEETIYSDTRVITTTSDLDLTQKQLDPKLFNILTSHKLEIPPLIDRKKDIPHLMEHFAGKISKIKHTQTKKFSKAATNKLLNYDYPGNVKELENVIERAIELSRDNETIEEEEIFLGDIDVEEKNRLNLLDIPLINKLCNSRIMFTAAKLTLVISFFAILYLLLVKPGILIGGKDIVLLLCWQIGLPVLFLTYLFAARLGCGICPMSSISKFLNKYISLKLPIPDSIKKQELLIMGLGFFFILFIEEYTHMSHSIINTAYLLLSVVSGVIIFDLIFEKSAWCRHICPLGGLSALFSMSSIIEIRANINTCTTICTTHDCYKGTARVGRCPMFLHLKFLQDNRNCKVCLNCIKNCMHHSPRLNLRIPGAEIGSLTNPSLTGAIMAIALCGLLIAEIPSKLGISEAGFPLIFSISIFFALSLNFLSSYITSLMSKSTAIEHFSHFGYTLLPLALSGFISLKLMEIFGNAEGSITLFKIYKFNFNFSNIIQAVLVAIGFFITEYLVYKVIHNKIGDNKLYRTFAIQGVAPLIFTILYISLFYHWNYTGYLTNIY